MTTKYSEIHIEWWNNQTGQEVLFAALAALPTVDGCVVHNPSVLGDTGAKWGECDLYFTIPTPHRWDFYQVVRAIREAGYRVKTAEGHSDDTRARLTEQAYYDACHARWEAESALYNTD